MPPSQPIRVLVIGTSGSGKTFFGSQLAQALDCPHIEMDGLYWGPHWQAVAPEVFEAAVDQATTGPCWVADGNYSAVRALLWPKASHVVWLNFSRPTVLRRILWRTFSRAFTRKPLYSGNRESWRMALLSKQSIIWWSMSTFRKNQSRYRLLQGDPAFAHLQWTEVHHPRHTAAVIDSLVNTSNHQTSPLYQNKESQ